MQWHIQAKTITTNIGFSMNLTLLALSVTNVVTWNCNVDDSAKGRYDIILGRYILTTLGLNFNFSDHVIEAYYGSLTWSKAPMVDLGRYEF